MSFLEFIKDNLLHVLPILIMGALALAISVERFKALYVVYPISDFEGFFAQITGFVSSGKLQDAVQHCDRFPTKPVAKIVKTALSRAHMPEPVIEGGLQIAISDATQMIQRRTSFLATIANVSTLLGLFGTILGLIHSFEAVGHADAQQKTALLSAGIATAMNATMLGLAVAIPAMIVFSILVNRSNRLLAEVETASERTLDILRQRFYSADHTSEGEKSERGSK